MLRSYLSPTPNFYSGWLWPYCFISTSRTQLNYLNANQWIQIPIVHYSFTNCSCVNLYFYWSESCSCDLVFFFLFRLKCRFSKKDENIFLLATNFSSQTPGICVKYFLFFPQKTCHQRRLRQTECLLFNFWMMKFAVIPKKQFSTWQFGKIGVSVNFIIQKLKSKHLVVCLSFL